MLSFLKGWFVRDNSKIEAALQNGAVILDVRSSSEYNQGHIQNSKNIPLNDISSKIELIKKWNKPVITVCQSGVRSAIAKSILASAGIEAHNGGAWTNLARIIL